ncbi:RidA family protein [Longimicrobium terrae]|uniref:Enamine deaminase RidA (YjgF/YER057c/UK114 family) n=1 Tax=Longimicrobium terrae TaxID=1639882 RepID=A0A841H5Z6_9BACT|nr:RidA family protein [Longimicrobium terrae]MBB4639047.1 enamine deaminase RidA (YjgF/YER057c/UK114 family) [Longimicrobium terrae]MBB6073352.1 enamine deaminase RidA (YjgF/YER057c/UK114 family) [Longimicrobium terrae]NNC28790.1 RidA family protein [Longimicrobium terrae]
MSRVLQPAHWGAPKGYVNGMEAEGRTVFVAGQIGWNPATCEFETDDFIGQVDQALRNIVTILAEAGAGPEHVTRMTWYITDRAAYLDNTRALGRVYRELFGKHFPAMAVVIVAGLLEEQAKVEIEATAVH